MDSLNTKYDMVILSGGGAKGIAHLGALHFQYEIGLLDPQHVKEYRGTSVGSIICILLICGYSPIEIMQYIYQIQNFLAGPGEQKGDTKENTKGNTIWDIIKKKGLIPIDHLFLHLEKMILEKLNKIPTLKELYDLSGKMLVIPTANVTKVRVEYLDHKTFPSLKVTDAAKMSSNLPGIFQEIVYNGDYYLDGGLGDNFPTSKIPKGYKTLGLLITGTDSAGYDLSSFNYIYRTMMFPVNTISLLKTKNLDKDFKLIHMVIDDIDVMELQMTTERKMKVFMTGYNISKCYSNVKNLYVKGWTDVGDDFGDRDDQVWSLSRWKGVEEWDI